MKITTKVALSAALLLAILLAAQRSDMALVRELLTAHQDVAEVRVRAVKITLDLLRTLEEADLSLKKLFVTRDGAYADNLDRLAHTISGQLATLEQLATTNLERSELAELSTRWGAYNELLAEARADLVARRARTSEEARRALLDSLAEVRDLTVRLFVAWEQGIDVELARAQRAAHRGERRAWWLAGLALASGLFFVVLIVRSVRGPLVRLVGATREVAAGNFVRLEPSGHDEFAELGRSFDRMVERLDEVDRMKRDFLSRVSHEIKTPLAAMQEAYRFISEGLAGPLTEQQRHMLELNREAGERLSVLLSRLLDSARFDAGAVTYDVRLIDLAQILGDTCQDLSSWAAGRDVHADLRLPARPCPVHGDAQWLQQVVTNLVDNAIKVSPPGGHLWVALDADVEAAALAHPAVQGRGPYVVLSVTDEGPGVAEVDRERIFERFVQLHKNAPTGGVGLGLAICRDVVNAHSGTIWVEDGPSGGSRFVVALPQARPAHVEPPEEGVVHGEHARAGTSVVDDDDAGRVCHYESGSGG